MTACNRRLTAGCWQRRSACGKDIILPSASAAYTLHMCIRLCDVFFCLVCVFVCVLRSPTVAQGQTWLAMLRFCGHPDQQITGLWLRMGCKSSNKPHGWRGMLKQTGSSGHMRLQPMQFAFTGRVRSLEERLVPFSMLQSCHSSDFHTLKPRPRVFDCVNKETVQER